MINCESYNITSIDRQLVQKGMDLKNYILGVGTYHPHKLNDKFFAEIYEIAKIWDKLFQDLVSPGKGV
jgi:hypothetical protein